MINLPHCKALTILGEWVYGNPVIEENLLYIDEISTVTFERGPGFHRIDGRTICESSGVTLPPEGMNRFCMEEHKKIVYDGDLINFEGRLVTIEKRTAHFSWLGSDYHLGTIAFLGSGPTHSGKNRHDKK
jgi:hypothetical protein